MEEFEWRKTGFHGQASSRIWGFEPPTIQPKMWHRLRIFTQIRTRGLLGSRQVDSAVRFELGWGELVAFRAPMAACMVGSRGGRRGAERERWGLRGRMKRREKANLKFWRGLTKTPLVPFFIFQTCWILNNASLTRILNSKPKSIIWPFIDYSFPKISTFDLMTNERNSKVDNLIVFGFLIDLILVNNR